MLPVPHCPLTNNTSEWIQLTAIRCDSPSVMLPISVEGRFTFFRLPPRHRSLCSQFLKVHCIFLAIKTCYLACPCHWIIPSILLHSRWSASCNQHIVYFLPVSPVWSRPFCTVRIWWLAGERGIDLHWARYRCTCIIDMTLSYCRLTLPGNMWGSTFCA